MVICIFCDHSSLGIYFIDCSLFFFLLDIVQYWGGWKTKLQLFGFLLPKPCHMTNQEFCAFAQRGSYLSCLQWERENVYPSWMNKTCRHLLQFALAFHHVQVMFIKWQKLGCFTYFAWRRDVVTLPGSSKWPWELHQQQRACSLQATLNAGLLQTTDKCELHWGREWGADTKSSPP